MTVTQVMLPYHTPVTRRRCGYHATPPEDVR